MTQYLVSGSNGVEFLIERARLDSGAGLGELLEFVQPAMLEAADRAVGPALRSRMSRSDLVQDALLTASQRFPAFRGSSEQELREWLMEILRSRLTDGLRRHRVAERRRQQKEIRVSGSQLVDKSSSPSETVTLDEEAAALLRGLDQLPPDLRDILNKRYFEDMTFEAIARLKRMSLTTVWRRWAEGVQILKRHLLSAGRD